MWLHKHFQRKEMVRKISTEKVDVKNGSYKVVCLGRDWNWETERLFWPFIIWNTEKTPIVRQDGWRIVEIKKRIGFFSTESVHINQVTNTRTQKSWGMDELFLPDYTILCSDQSKKGQRGTKRTKNRPITKMGGKQIRRGSRWNSPLSTDPLAQNCSDGSGQWTSKLPFRL